MKFVSTLLIALSLSGCVTRTIELPNGIKYKSVSFLTNPNIGAVRATGGKDHIDFQLGGYGHNQTDILKTISALAALGSPVP